DVAPVASLSRGAGTAGVRTTCPAIVAAAARMSSMVTVIGQPPDCRPILLGARYQCQDFRAVALQLDGAAVPPARHEIAVVRRQRIARLSAGDDEARAIEIGGV